MSATISSVNTRRGSAASAPRVLMMLLIVTMASPPVSQAAVRSSANYSQVHESLNSGGGIIASKGYAHQTAIGDPVLGMSAQDAYAFTQGFPLVPNPAAFLLVSVTSNVDRLGEVWKDAAVLTFTRSSGIPFETRVDYSLTGDAAQDVDYTLEDEEIVFRPGETTAQATIFAINDLVDEATEAFTLQILAAPDYQLSAPSAATIEIERIVYTSQGDVNADETLNILDAIAVANHLSGSNLLVGDALDRADVDDDGSLTTDDLDWILSVILWEIQQDQ